jgi:transcriptional regulator with XRE-family HTH domain
LLVGIILSQEGVSRDGLHGRPVSFLGVYCRGEVVKYTGRRELDTEGCYMADSVTPSELGLAIFLARTLRGWTQTDLADASGLTNSMLSEFERGRRTPSKRSLDRITEAIGMPPESLNKLVPALKAFRESVEVGVVKRVSQEDEGREKVEIMTDDLLRASLHLIFKDKMPRRNFTPVRSDREEAPELWNRLRGYDQEDRFLLVEEGKEYQDWALCELVCHESAKAARQDPPRAVELAVLAVRIAERVPGKDAWRSRLQGYAWAHLGYARRANRDLLGAEEALLRAGLHWRAGAGAPPGLLDEARIRAIDDAVVRS